MLTGQQLGTYTIGSMVGSGGMSWVYESYQTAVRRKVAIKVLPKALAANPNYQARFEREVDLAARLEHPHILPIYDFGIDDGNSFIVMRLLTGGTLAQRLLHFGCPAPAEALAILTDVASALDYAHKQGVIHRDIKANNVMFDGEGHVYLADFGIARVMSGLTSGLTTTGQVIGTPAYMAPEQWSGEALDTRTDVYAFGVMAYLVLTGELPYEADTQYTLMYKHLQSVPPAASSKNKQLNRKVDLALAQAMAKKPDQRFATAGEFITALKQALPHLPAEKPQPGFSARAIKTPASAQPAMVASPDDPTHRQQPPKPPGVAAATGQIVISTALVTAVIVAGLMFLWLGNRGDVQPLIITATPQTAAERLIATEEVKPTATTRPTSTPLPPTPTILSLIHGYVEPVTINADWEPVIETFNGVDMVLVPMGCFEMGSTVGDADELPVHEQCFDQPFWIDRTEVTRAMYAECIAAEQCTDTVANTDSIEPQQPINGVNWIQATAYCEWRGARLPTEREWEYAARGVDSLLFPWGSTFAEESVVYARNSQHQTAVVGSRVSGESWVGAWDMSGNVWEWVSSVYMPYPYKPDDGRENPATRGSRVVRGGSYVGQFASLRSAFRDRYSPTESSNYWGFRCARAYEG